MYLELHVSYDTDYILAAFPNIAAESLRIKVNGETVKQCQDKAVAYLMMLRKGGDDIAFDLAIPMIGGTDHRSGHVSGDHVSFRWALHGNDDWFDVVL